MNFKIIIVDLLKVRYMKEKHYHYFICLKDNLGEIYRVLEIVKKKITMKKIVDLEKKNKFATVISVSELECDCDE